MEKALPPGNLLDVIGGLHSLTSHPRLPETVLVLAWKVLKLKNPSVSSKLRWLVITVQRPSHSRKSLFQGESLPSVPIKIFVKQLCVCTSAQNFFSMGEGLSWTVWLSFGHFPESLEVLAYVALHFTCFVPQRLSHPSPCHLTRKGA